MLNTAHPAPPHLAEFLADRPPIALCSAVASNVENGLVLWIGRRCWPYPPSLNARLLERSIYVETQGRDDLLWSVDLALRSRAVSVVVADSRGLTMANSRRLQLAAEAGGTTALLVRPLRDRGELSAATTRWLVSPGPCDPATPISPTWTLELLRRKGLRPVVEDARVTTVRVVNGTRLVSVDADVSDRPAAATGPGQWAAQRSG